MPVNLSLNQTFLDINMLIFSKLVYVAVLVLYELTHHLLSSLFQLKQIGASGQTANAVQGVTR